MIVTVSLNPCLDWVYEVDEIVIGGLNRVNFTRQDIGGKGINVCNALNNLGLSPVCTGFNFVEGADILTEKLRGINHDFVTVNAPLRVNIKVYSGGVMTEFNQPGAVVSDVDVKLLLEKISSYNSEDAVLVLSGSLPKGVPAETYSRICKGWNGKIFLDTYGEALLRVLETSPPFVVKPNLFELTATFNTKLDSPLEITEFCRENLINKGVYAACVSMGADGAVLVSKNNAWYSPALKIQALGVQGAGDAMVAGLLFALHNNYDVKEYLPAAMAAASASACLEGTEMCSFEGFMDKLPIAKDYVRICR